MRKDEFQPLIDEEAPLEPFAKKVFKSVFASTFYMTVSIALVFINRIVLSKPGVKAGALFVSWYQFVIAYILILFLSSFCQKIPVLNIFPPIHYERDTLFHVIPVSIFFLLMIGFNNKCLEYVSVSGYQIVRSLTIIFNIILTFIILHKKTPFLSILACIGVIVGFFVGVEGDIDLTWKGVAFGVTSSFFVASYSIAVKKTSDYVNGNNYLLIEYTTPLAILFLTPIVWYNGEFDVIFHDHPTNEFWIWQTVAGVIGLVINIATFLSITWTSPLTHTLSGTVKACLQSLIAFWLFPGTETLTTKKLIGTICIIVFTLLYYLSRNLDMKAKYVRTPPVFSNAESQQKLV